MLLQFFQPTSLISLVENDFEKYLKRNPSATATQQVCPKDQQESLKFTRIYCEYFLNDFINEKNMMLTKCGIQIFQHKTFPLWMTIFQILLLFITYNLIFGIEGGGVVQQSATIKLFCIYTMQYKSW